MTVYYVVIDLRQEGLSFLVTPGKSESKATSESAHNKPVSAGIQFAGGYQWGWIHPLAVEQHFRFLP